MQPIYLHGVQMHTLISPSRILLKFLIEYIISIPVLKLAFKFETTLLDCQLPLFLPECTLAALYAN